MDLIKTYHIKSDSTDWFLYYLRLNLEWDDNRYMEMMELINSILNEYKNQLLVPKLLVPFFMNEIELIIGIASHPNFTKLNISWIKCPEDRMKYKELVERRIHGLKEMQNNFCNKFCSDYMMNGDNKQQADRISDKLSPLSSLQQHGIKDLIKSDSSDWFLNYLRLTLEWDDNRYMETVELINTILNEYRNQILVPKSLVKFFMVDVEQIIAFVSLPNFTNIDIMGIKSPEYKELIEKRIHELNRMKYDFWGNYCCDYMMDDGRIIKATEQGDTLSDINQ